MSGDFMSNITVDLNDLQGSLFCCEFIDMLISESTVGVPVCSEVDESMGESVSGQVMVELF